MTDINKQKFLAELGKLLTFMYEEDRQSALAMYSEMFDSAADEQTLLQQLVSPTRQAVVIARTYNQRERRLHVAAQSREESYYDEPDEVPAYVIAIEDIRRQVIGSQRRAAEEKEQSSLFEPEDIETEEEPEEEPARPAPDKSSAFAGAAVELLSEETGREQEEEPAEETVESESTEESAEAVVAVEDAGDISFTEQIHEEEQLPEEAQEAEDFEEPAPIRRDMRRNVALQNEGSTRSRRSRAAGASRRRDEFRPTERKARPLLLVLYTIVALPIGIVGGLILMLPIILFLALTVAAVWMGISAISTAFGGFAMFSDLMVVLGGGLVLLALGLLFLWLFVWFIGGVLAGFINGIINLGSKLCYKEVEVE